MNLRYKVTLEGIKGFYRVYTMNGDTTLYTFHKQMRADMEFPQDQLIMFKALDADGAVVARYGLFDLGSGTVDNVTLSDTLAAGVASFVYFYDVTNRKSVIVTFMDESDGPSMSPKFPRITDSKGPNPIDFENGYVAYEDLPDEQKIGFTKSSSTDDEDIDDEDFDEEDGDEDEEEDDEDGKEIFDENEGI